MKNVICIILIDFTAVLLLSLPITSSSHAIVSYAKSLNSHIF
jgi:hypothetical protein